MRFTEEQVTKFGKQCFEAGTVFDTWEKYVESISIPTKNEDYMDVAEKLYRYKNPTSKMCTPNSAYINMEKWHYEWQKESTELNLFDWVIKNK